MKRSHKVQMLVWISGPVDVKFRALIQQKYDEYEKGLLSYEVELAMRNWLALHTNAQTPLVKPNPTPKVAIAFAQCKDYLLRQHQYFELNSGQQINVEHMKNAIMAVKGSDPRTIKGWLMRFKRFKLMRPVVGNVWEIM